MSNKLPPTDSIAPLLDALRTAPTAPDAKIAAAAIAKEVKTLGMTLLE
jgi:elongation factor 3